MCEKISTRASIQNVFREAIWSTTRVRERESQRQKSSHTTWTHWSRRSHKMFHIHFYSSTSTLGEIFSTSFVENCEVLCVYVLLIVCSYRVNLCLGLRVIKSIIVSVCLISSSYKNKRKRREIKNHGNCSAKQCDSRSPSPRQCIFLSLSVTN